MEIGNQTQNHKIETNSELIYEDGIIWSTLIFIKIIGSDALWFPSPPSEVLDANQFSNFLFTLQSKVGNPPLRSRGELASHMWIAIALIFSWEKWELCIQFTQQLAFIFLIFVMSIFTC